ncbi:Spc98 family-domain-containing protein [Dunaliella salina]|uniref:Gamma-tubulin complex component n=1 Tax=Dunaliella salina TaxID=3046 RepID=A0ABQ7GJ56_DUNSA|nr:Spc98 family-domain-containing protein [Dunaliella salina]|eukprot:KAF5834637.1 Spc98 family-domain-containing protein [Dunaliella salina]
MGGAQLLAVIQSAARCGVPIVQSCMQRLLWHCNQVLFKQLTSWMVHGKLLDPYNEFFIKQHGSQVQQPQAAPDSSQQVQQQREASAQEALLNWHQSFQVYDPAVPPHISAAAAESVAFIGKAVLLLKNPAGAFRGAELLQYRDTLEFMQALRTLQAAPVFDRVAFERTVEGIRAKVAALLWHLVVVQADLMAHLAAIKDYFLMAKGELYHSFLVDARKALAAPPRPHTADADVNIAFQQAALKSTAQHDALFARFRIHWAPPQPPPDPSQRPKTPPPLPGPANAYALPNIEVPRFDANWDSMWLEYQGEWPLGLLITPQVLGRYNALFQMLLRLKRVQLRLEEAWQALSALDQWQERSEAGRRARAEGSGAKATLQDLRQLRHHMSHLISNLQIYIQVDVIESNYSQLEARIAAAQDFSEVERAHANYLHALMQQTFLNTTTICRTIAALFLHVQELCQLVDAATSHANAAALSAELGEDPLQDPAGGSLLTAAEQHKLATTRSNFSQRMTELYTFLHSTRLQDVNKAPHLRQFYLRLNFNEYVSRKIVSAKVVGGSGGPALGRPSIERPASAVAALLAARRGG